MVEGLSLKAMEVEFDAAKDRANLVKHGISLAAAVEMDLDRTRVVPDGRRDYGEPRFVGIGPIGGRLQFLAFTMRGGTLRAISLRRTNDRERQRYERA